tara:strand:- start:853 stop:1539 length:687 start_codon:yes stop_codon:yes gene_type:complete
MNKSNLILVRHGQSEWNKQDKFTGWVDIPLSSHGINEAKEAGIKISNLGIKFNYSFSSVLERSIQTYREINKICLIDAKLETDWRLNERHYGGLQGLNKQEMRSKHGDEQVLIWRRSYDTKPPEINKNSHEKLINQKCFNGLNIDPFPKNESLKDTFFRLMPFLENILIPLIKLNENILISAHGNSIRAILKYFEKISDDNIVKVEIPTGKPLLLEFKSEKLVFKKYI